MAVYRVAARLVEQRRSEQQHVGELVENWELAQVRAALGSVEPLQ